MNTQRMVEQLVLHEGLRLKPYLDTEGYWTVGVGFNLTARGVSELIRITGRMLPKVPSAVRITEEEAYKALRYDIERIHSYLTSHYAWYPALGDARQRVCIDMGFNLGHRAEKFVNTIHAIEECDYVEAARGLYASKWAHQVDDGEGGRFGRADRLVRMLITGEDYTK